MKNYFFPKSVGEQWIDALRSGKYKQGYNNLYSAGRYCALGVLGKCLNFPIEKEGGTALNHFIKEEKLRNSLIQPVKNRTFETQIMYMNDQYKKTFEEIADWLEQNLELEDE